MKAPVLLQSGEGHTLTASGTQTIFKMSSELTEGRFSIVEYLLPPNFPGPPPHVHKQFAHAWYILEGTVQIQLEHQIHQASEGAFVFVPAGIAHTFSNPGESVVRMLAIDTPGGLESYYEELAEALPAGKPPNPTVIAEIQSRYDTYPASKLTS